MSAAILNEPVDQLAATSPRRIALRTRGRRHGPITRLMSPSDWGQRLKPFVFLDLFDMADAQAMNMGLHPHSGIATLTWLMQGSAGYEDTTGGTGVLPARGLEWMQAGGGAWHSGGPGDAPRVRGFQLWVALPPEAELGAAYSTYLSPEAIPYEGPAAVLMGRYGAAVSPLTAPMDANYLAVRLQAGERWRYQPPVGHTVGWVAVGEGRLQVTGSGALDAGDLVAFEDGDGALEFQAETATEFMLGSAVPHAHDLVMGNYSVHTSEAALRQGEAGIMQIAGQLKAQGRLR